MAEVILIRPSNMNDINESTYSDESRPPAGLLYIAAPLVEHGIDVIIIDQTAERQWYERLIENLNDKTVCVGITSLTGNMIKNGIEIVKMVREHSDCPVVWGGTHPSIEYETTIQSEYVDIVVEGEGEETFFELVMTLKDKRSYENIKGIVYKKDGLIQRNIGRELYDLNKIPPLPVHLTNIDNYRGHVGLSAFFRFKYDTALSIETSRGCNFKCTYCVLANENYGEKANWRSMSALKIIEIVEENIDKYGVRAFAFIDDNFFVDVERAKEFVDLIFERNLDIEWFADMRMDTIAKFMDVDFLKALEKAGLRSLGIGIETGSERMLRFLHKGQKRKHYIDANKMLAETGVVAQYGLIQGLPTETVSDVGDTYTLIAELIKDNPKCLPVLNKLLPTPGTPILDQCVKSGFNPPKKFEDWVDYCDVGWTHGRAEWMDEESAKLIMSNLYINVLLIMRMTLENSLLVKIAFSFAMKLILFRIRKQFYALKVEKLLYSVYKVYSKSIFLKQIIRRLRYANEPVSSQH